MGMGAVSQQSVSTELRTSPEAQNSPNAQRRMVQQLHPYEYSKPDRLRIFKEFVTETVHVELAELDGEVGSERRREKRNRINHWHARSETRHTRRYEDARTENYRYMS